MFERRPDHPSGRPIRKPGLRLLGFTRRPPDEPLTPGLRKAGGQTNAIGFRANITAEDDE